MQMGTQWQPGSMGGYTGLRYEALPLVMQWAGIVVEPADMPEVFHSLRWLEGEALKLLNKRDED